MPGIPVALNVDGIERKRKKWNRAARSVVPDVGMAGHVLPDARRDRRAEPSSAYYRERYGKETRRSFPMARKLGHVETPRRSTGWVSSPAAISSM